MDTAVALGAVEMCCDYVTRLWPYSPSNPTSWVGHIAPCWHYRGRWRSNASSKHIYIVNDEEEIVDGNQSLSHSPPLLVLTFGTNTLRADELVCSWDAAAGGRFPEYLQTGERCKKKS